MQTRHAVLAALACLISAPAAAAPISRPADLVLELSLVGDIGLRGPAPYYYYHYGPEVSIERSAQVSVDVAAGTIGLAADVLAATGPIHWLVDGTTAINSISIIDFSHGEAVFSIGGASGLPDEPPCPLASAGACVAQLGFGGPMPLAGVYNVEIIPNVVVIPLALGRYGTSGSENTPFTADYAPWTVRTATVFTTHYSSTLTIQGSVTASGFRLVAPTYISALGNILPSFATLQVTFSDGLGVPGFVSGEVPEPEAIWLAFAAAALALAFHRRG